MKKTLLLCVALATATLASAQTVINAYDYTTCNVLPSARNQGANVPAASFDLYNGASQFAAEGGLLAVSGGQWANDAQPYYANLIAGMSFVDLGGEVGRCLCLYGPKVTEESVAEFDFNTYYNCNIPMSTGGINWGNLNFYTDPSTTPTATDGEKDMTKMAKHVRVEMIVNIYSQEAKAGNFFNFIYTVDDQGNVRPTQNVANTAPGNAIALEEFFDPDTYEWNSDKWLKYEFDTYVQGPDEKGVLYSPLHLKMEMNGGNWAGSVCFIKSIKFYEVSDIVMNGDEGRLRTWVEMKPELDKIVSGVDAVKTSMVKNGRTYDLSGREVSAATKGFYIQNGKKVVK